MACSIRAVSITVPRQSRDIRYSCRRIGHWLVRDGRRCYASARQPLAAAGMRVETPPSVAITIGHDAGCPATAAPPLDHARRCARALQACECGRTSGRSAAPCGRSGSLSAEQIAACDHARRPANAVLPGHVLVVWQRAAEGSVRTTAVLTRSLAAERNAMQQPESAPCITRPRHAWTAGGLTANQRDE